MTPKEAANRAGCNVSHIRHCIRKGIIKAEWTEMPGGYYYDISEDELQKFMERHPKSGWLRGMSRS